MITAWRTFSVAVSAFALLIGCGSPTDTDSGATTTTETTETGFDTTGTEPTDTTERTTTNGARLINVAGARLDGRSDTSSWPRFSLHEDDSTRTECKPFFVNEDTSVPITVDVSLSNSAVFQLLSSGEDCSSNDGDCRGFTFPPVNGKSQQSCRVNVEASRPSSSQAQATVTFTFNALCPSTAGKPCDDPKVAPASPSPSKPVPVTWRKQVTLTAVVFPCRPEELEEGPDGQRICPTTDTTTTTSQTTTTTSPTTTPPTS